MKTKTYWLVLFALFIIASLPVMLWGSTSIVSLEHKIIKENHTQIETIRQYPFGESGLLVMGADELGVGKMYALVRMPGLDRYWVSAQRDYTTDQTNVFAEKDLTHWVALKLNNEEITVTNSKTGLGYLNSIFMRILMAAAIASIGALIVDKIVRKKESN
jgi:hypothetical protein